MQTHFPSIQGAPLAAKKTHTTKFHGVTLEDDYFWLRAENWQEAMREPEKLPEDIKSYLTQENDYYDAAMADTKALQDKLISEMRGRIKEDDSSVPVKDGAFAYSWKYTEGGEHPIRIRTPVMAVKKKFYSTLIKRRTVKNILKLVLLMKIQATQYLHGAVILPGLNIILSHSAI